MKRSIRSGPIELRRGAPCRAAVCKNCYLRSSRLAVGTADHHEVTVWVPKPHLAVGGRGVHVEVFDDLGAQCSSAINGCVQIVKLEPHQYPVSIPSTVGIAKVRVVLRVPRVELEHQHAVDEEPIVEMGVIGLHQLARARGSEQRRVPTGARAHVADR